MERGFRGELKKRGAASPGWTAGNRPSLDVAVFRRDHPGRPALPDRGDVPVAGDRIADQDLELRAVTAAAVDLGEQSKAGGGSLDPVALGRALIGRGQGRCYRC